MNKLYYGDNLKVLREHIKDESVDLIYLDPPFNSNRSYNVLFKDESGLSSDAQITAFDDAWHWGDTAQQTYEELLTNAPGNVALMINSLHQFIGANQMMAYLVMMAARLVELHRVLKPTGTLYLHCDPTASHYLKIILDTVFGIQNFRSEITWLRSKNPKGSQYEVRQYSPDTDILLFYSKTDEAKLNYLNIKTQISKSQLDTKYDRFDEIGRFTDGPILRSASMGERPNLVYEYKGYKPDSSGWRVTFEKLVAIDEAGNLGWSSTGKPYRKIRPESDTGNPIGNCWIDISLINSQSAERLGYPTQKPLSLLERIINASSNPGDVVLDPFSGCGTCISAAQKLGRQWIGIDITHLAIAMHKARLKDMFSLEPKADYQVIGEPQDLSGAKQLASEDRYQFQWWALSLIEARPMGGNTSDKTGKKGSDKGIDGVINFLDDRKGGLKRALIQVKSGHVKSGDIRDLKGTLDRENAQIGVFITLEDPSKDMLTEAVTAGSYHSDIWNKDFPKIQILTIEQLLAGVEVKLPPSSSGAFKQAEKADTDGAKQPNLGI